jgi:hypothetical protein
MREQQDLLQISSVHRLDAEAREEHLKGELMRREQLSVQAQQVDEADQNSLKVSAAKNRSPVNFLAVAPCIILSQDRVAYLQQQLLKEEELTSATKSRLEQAQIARVAAEEELAKQEALFAEKQVACCSIQTIIYPPRTAIPAHVSRVAGAHTRGGCVVDAGALRSRQCQGCLERAAVCSFRAGGFSFCVKCRMKVVHPVFQETKRAKDATVSELEMQLSDLLARRYHSTVEALLFCRVCVALLFYRACVACAKHVSKF